MQNVVLDLSSGKWATHRDTCGGVTIICDCVYMEELSTEESKTLQKYMDAVDNRYDASIGTWGVFPVGITAYLDYVC